MPKVPLAYVGVYQCMIDIFHMLAYASTIRNSVTGPLLIALSMFIWNQDTLNNADWLGPVSYSSNRSTNVFTCLNFYYNEDKLISAL